MSRSEFFSGAADHNLAELDAASLTTRLNAAMDTATRRRSRGRRRPSGSATALGERVVILRATSPGSISVNPPAAPRPSSGRS